MIDLMPTYHAVACRRFGLDPPSVVCPHEHTSPEAARVCARDLCRVFNHTNSGATARPQIHRTECPYVSKVKLGPCTCKAKSSTWRNRNT